MVVKYSDPSKLEVATFAGKDVQYYGVRPTKYQLLDFPNEELPKVTRIGQSDLEEIIPKIIRSLKKQDVPVHEPGVVNYIQSNLYSNHHRFVRTNNYFAAAETFRNFYEFRFSITVTCLCRFDKEYLDQEFALYEHFLAWSQDIGAERFRMRVNSTNLDVFARRFGANRKFIFCEKDLDDAE